MTFSETELARLRSCVRFTAHDGMMVYDDVTVAVAIKLHMDTHDFFPYEEEFEQAVNSLSKKGIQHEHS